MPSARIIWGQLTDNSTNSIAKNIRLNLDMTLQIKIIEYWGLNERLPQFGKSFPSSGGKKRSWLIAKALSSGGLSFFRSNPLFRLSCFLAFTTILWWLLFILILHLDSLTILFLISYLCWSCWTYCWGCFQYEIDGSGKPTESLDKSPIEVGKS